MDANRFNDTPVSPASISMNAPAPSIWQAAGLIALYFILQLAIGGLTALAAGLVSILQHGGAITSVFALGRAWLAQSDATAIAVMLTLVISASLILHSARQWWPRLWSEPAPPGLGFTPASPFAMYFAALFVGLLMPVVGGMLTQWLAQGHEVSQDIKQLGANTSLALRLPLALLVISLGPLVEELLFRGVLLSAIARFTGNNMAIVLTAAIFACVHLPDLSFLWYALPNLMLLGLLLGWLRVRSGSIWPAVFAHGLNNLLAVVSWFLMTPGN